MPAFRMSLLLSATLLALPVFPAAAQGPSFDCDKAGVPAERMICADPDLAALDQAIARAYAGLRAALDAGDAEILREDQRRFLATRNAAGDDDLHAPGSLRGMMGARLAFLHSVEQVPRTGFAGFWANASGSVTITQVDVRRHRIEIHSVEPLAARWLCHLVGDAEERIGSTALWMQPDEAAARELEIHADWALALPADRALEGAFCGLNGTFAGRYFPVSSLPGRP